MIWNDSFVKLLAVFSTDIWTTISTNNSTWARGDNCEAKNITSRLTARLVYKADQ